MLRHPGALIGDDKEQGRHEGTSRFGSDCCSCGRGAPYRGGDDEDMTKMFMLSEFAELESQCYAIF